ncbi:hypothetical protein D8674_012952 [Pyrus ussuriensis x Pyrus communis]|uniref:DUF4218 domain-containing protein n=1 Tax=Pyrus ussuriensis x Pyrus communis TaxID=2448454 RepID=A0A5N5GQU1_9ROSA|nr:hypothetical protein D8674_012952 [Pyrus ussuriensis x Pyrus communis]
MHENKPFKSHEYAPIIMHIEKNVFDTLALLANPVNGRWMYPIERYLGELKKCVRNKAKPEGSLVGAWVAYKSLTFCAMYLQDVETAFNRPQCNNDNGVRKVKLIKFLRATRDDKSSTQNSGVHVPGVGDSEDIDFYGQLTSVVQLLYKDKCQEPIPVDLFRDLGNAYCNSVWEGTLLLENEKLDGSKDMRAPVFKPGPKDAAQRKEIYIQAKSAHDLLKSSVLRLEVGTGAAQVEGGVPGLFSYEKKSF